MLMVFDDVQWGAESLGFVAQLLADDAQIPLLFVLTAREESLSEQPVEHARLSALLDHDVVDEIVVEPLSQTDQAELVRRLLRLESRLADDVVERSAGNPLFAVQLTDDWVHRGVLSVGDSGFVLASGAKATVPQELRSVWGHRFERFLAGCEDSNGVRDAIEIGAALGQAPSNREWHDVVRLAGLTVDRDVIDALARAGLVKRGLGRWRFCHAMFREAILANAQAEGRAAQWHGMCADHLAQRFGLAPEVAERHAGHLVAAQRYDEALPRILDAAEAHARTGEFDRVDRMFHWYDDIIARLDRDVRADQVRGQLHRVRTALFEASLDDVEPVLVEAERAVEELGDPALRAEALFVRSRLNRHRGEPEHALEPAEAALEIMSASSSPNIVQLALLRRSLGELYRIVGRLEEAKQQYGAAMKLFGDLDDDFQVGWCELGLAATAKQRGDEELYVQHFEAAAAAFEQSRSYGALGCAYNEKGEWLRAHGRLEEALEVYQESLRILPRNHSEVGVAQFNLGLTHMAAESWGLARDWMRRAADSFAAHGRQGAMTYVDLGMLVCAAAERRWEEVEHLDRRVSPVVTERRFTNQDVARLLLQAGDLCSHGAEFKRADHYWELSRVHWARLGRQDELDELARRLSATTSTSN